MTKNIDQLYAALETSAVDVPYAITRTDEGFKVELDLYTPRVMQRAQRMNIDRSFTIDVLLDERKHKAKLTDTLRELHWGPAHTLGFSLGASIQKGAVIGKTISFGGSDADKALNEEMKPFTISAAKSWVRELLEANDWKVGGLGSLFG